MLTCWALQRSKEQKSPAPEVQHDQEHRRFTRQAKRGQSSSQNNFLGEPRCMMSMGRVRRKTCRRADSAKSLRKL
eukprot:766399-Hanusia_phi.AAC.3